MQNKNFSLNVIMTVHTFFSQYKLKILVISFSNYGFVVPSFILLQ